jgi:hypothetical protein
MKIMAHESYKRNSRKDLKMSHQKLGFIIKGALCALLLVTAICSCEGVKDEEVVKMMGANPTKESVAQIPTSGQDLSLEEKEKAQEWLNARYEEEDIVDKQSTESGIAFDCVLFNKQPAFHYKKIQKALGETVSDEEIEEEEIAANAVDSSKPSIPEEVLESIENHKQEASAGEQYAELESVNCPEGSVPIRHYEMADVEAAGGVEKLFYKSKQQSTEPPGSSSGTHEYAHMYYNVSNRGGSVVTNLWNPAVASSVEFSLMQTWVVRGSGSDRQTIESGWQDYKQRTGSSKPKFFVYSTSDNYAHGCYDDQCGRWVQVDTVYSPGMGWSNYSSSGGTQYVFDSYWLWTGDGWCLVYKGRTMGCYPLSLFDSAGLHNRASRVDFGGEVFVYNGSSHSTTDMGSGRFPSAGWTHAAYMRTMQYSSLDDWPVFTDVPPNNGSRTDPDCYDISVSSSSGGWGTYAYLGGTGFNQNCGCYNWCGLICCNGGKCCGPNRCVGLLDPCP